jgi:heme/copper-type cytochrome/quinol oxidase subunit 2
MIRNILLQILILVAILLPIFVITFIGITIYPEKTIWPSSSATKPQQHPLTPERDAGTPRDDPRPSGIMLNNTRTIEVTIRQLKFTPDPIIVNEGEKVQMEVTSHGASHNIAIPELGIKETVEPMQPKTIEFQAGKPGRYSMICNVNCGIGNEHLQGELVVQKK